MRSVSANRPGLVRAPVRLATAALLVLFLGGCPAKDPDLLRLKQMDDAKKTPGYAAFCDMSIQCGSADAHICTRVHAHVGAACLARADAQSGSASPAVMQKVTGDAETAFRAALAKAVDDSEKLTAERGAAEALELRRTFSSQAGPINSAIEALAVQLDAVPGGAPYAGYYRAGVKENIVLSASPSPSQCPDIKAALALLPASASDAVLAQRTEQRRAGLKAAMTSRSCP